ncbi:2-C-methyl-D-erythritol 4-phosphate cytidylyltransferase [Herbivorax sp. ANBcel31]|uniref:2-C-methyl-D-erythritol 4-phosphate cytidylyltransferase n=1 Tax=Herbivorax sp. ANBcel31 TaxID=3069754 RepID=UPI0027B01775|nr:2-C-methyl-D-erythritol 4-phosphate cytidylyltransferase [Herbivorax sp. ANBcel31]MDQ2087619.1 2-C-methyl-D-erythritol 4-phosphate cytidylyltransferase [Herbivorax sp. ANBcel31]
MKKNKSFVSVVVVAGGKGTRMNMDINKQYVCIGEKPVLARTLSVFEENDIINEIILVVSKDEMFYCKENIIDKFDFKKIKHLVTGGAERQNSVFKGLMEVSKQSDIVVIHDGARPFVNDEIIKNSIEEVLKFGAVTAAVPVKDTIKSAYDGFVEKTYDRKTLWSIQTPQVFLYDTIMKAHEKANKENITSTDDTSLTEMMGVKTRIVKGSYDNIKITTREDLTFAKAVIQQ